MPGILKFLEEAVNFQLMIRFSLGSGKFHFPDNRLCLRHLEIGFISDGFHVGLEVSDVVMDFRQGMERPMMLALMEQGIGFSLS